MLSSRDEELQRFGLTPHPLIVFHFQTCSLLPTDTDSSDITWGHLSDFTQLLLGLEWLKPNNVFLFWSKLILIKWREKMVPRMAVMSRAPPQCCFLYVLFCYFYLDFSATCTMPKRAQSYNMTENSFCTSDHWWTTLFHHDQWTITIRSIYSWDYLYLEKRGNKGNKGRGPGSWSGCLVYIPPHADTVYEVTDRTETLWLEAAFIVARDFNNANLRKVLPRYYHQLSYPMSYAPPPQQIRSHLSSASAFL